MPNNLVNRDPEIISGALVLAGTSVPVEAIFDYLEGGEPLANIIAKSRGKDRSPARLGRNKKWATTTISGNSFRCVYYR